MRKLLMTAVAIGVFVVALAAPAGAQVYPPPSVGGITAEQPSPQPGAPSAGGGGTLPFTGSDAVSLALIGAGAVAVGAVFVVAARRRQRVLSRA